uniref:Uncharacterized protein n=1 Tax=Musca domestica TaxID=7370 RepID=A0A1I8MSN1_MUSDO
MPTGRSFNFGSLLIVTLLTVVRGVPQWHNSTDARHECARRNLQLVEIETKEKNEALLAVLKPIFGNSHNLWLGAMDEYNRDKNFKRPFYWSSSGKPMTFSYWSDNNPDNYKQDEHCVHTWASKSNYLWNDNRCDHSRFGFICEDHYLHAEQQKMLSEKVQKLRQPNAKLFEEYHLQQKEYSEKLSSLLAENEAGEMEFKEVLHNIYTKLEFDISHALAQHQREVNSLVENRNEVVHKRNAELRTFNEEMSKKFSKELEAAKIVYDDVLTV